MKINLTILLSVGTLVMANIADAAEVKLCTTTTSFLNSCTINAGKYCCPNDNYQVQRSCPDGWILNGTTCSRDSTTGSDETGTFTIEYTSCDAVELKEYCCDIKTGLSLTESNRCVACIPLNQPSL